MKPPAMERICGSGHSVWIVNTSKGTHPLAAVHLQSEGIYQVTVTGRMTGSELAQLTISLKNKGEQFAVFSVHGSGTSPQATFQCAGCVTVYGRLGREQ